ncbi:MAG: hypothetical protein RLZZ381_1012 [Cyanobacteriota bacterium]|jgi:hypothetical protein
MKFDKAYCQELDQSISPYVAREIYFDEESAYFDRKLTFFCEHQNCRVNLVPVIIYRERRSKQALHFRTAPGKTHSSSCDYALPKETNDGKRQAAQSARGFKETHLPTEFLLERPKKETDINIVAVEKENTNTEPKHIKSEGTSRTSNNQSVVKTSSLEQIVDCYQNVSKTELENHPLKIKSKTKYFRNFFKKIRYFSDEEGLIYWGTIKEVKRYGQNYSIKFQNTARLEERELSISIYLKNKTIEKYRKRRLFREQINGIVESNEEILCFFVGAYPKLVEVQKKDGTTFSSFNVDIQNLDHLVFTFG